MARYHPHDWTWLAVADLDDESVSERSLEHKGMLRLTVLALACLHAAEGYVPSLSAPRAERRAAERAGLLRQPAAHMCGVLAVVNSQQSPDALRLQTLTLQRLVRHRGPDGSGIHVIEHDCPTSGNCLCSSIAPRPCGHQGREDLPVPERPRRLRGRGGPRLEAARSTICRPERQLVEV